MTPEQMVQAQQRLAGHGGLAVGVTGAVAEGRDRRKSVDQQDGERVPVRIYRSERRARVEPGHRRFHGGGWTLGALEQSDWLSSEVCIGGAARWSVFGRLPVGARAHSNGRAGQPHRVT